MDTGVPQIRALTNMKQEITNASCVSIRVERCVMMSCPLSSWFNYTIVICCKYDTLFVLVTVMANR